MLRRLLGPGYYLAAFGCIVVLLFGLAVPGALALLVGEAVVDSLVLGALVGLVCLYGLGDAATHTGRTLDAERVRDGKTD